MTTYSAERSTSVKKMSKRTRESEAEAELRAENKELRAENAALKQQVDELADQMMHAREVRDRLGTIDTRVVSTLLEVLKANDGAAIAELLKLPAVAAALPAMLPTTDEPQAQARAGVAAARPTFTNVCLFSCDSRRKADWVEQEQKLARAKIADALLRGVDGQDEEARRTLAAQALAGVKVTSRVQLVANTVDPVPDDATIHRIEADVCPYEQLPPDQTMHIRSPSFLRTYASTHLRFAS